MRRARARRAAPDGTRTTLGSRVLGTTCVVRDYRPAALTLVLGVLGVLLAMSSGTHVAFAVLALAVVLAQGLRFARAATAWTPRSEVFPPTETSALLRSEQGFARVLGGPGVLPYDTGLADGLRVLDGYDALDVASFDAYRPYAARPGAHPILDWNARGVALESPAFRLLGAHWLALADPLDAPGWELVAGPSAGAPREAECFVYRAVAPLPRVFCGLDRSSRAGARLARPSTPSPPLPSQRTTSSVDPAPTPMRRSWSSRTNACTCTPSSTDAASSS
jgi:hypothetical protein